LIVCPPKQRVIVLDRFEIKIYHSQTPVVLHIEKQSMKVLLRFVVASSLAYPSDMNGEDEFLVGKNVDLFPFRDSPHIGIVVRPELS
jgi:hypothetical protein